MRHALACHDEGGDFLTRIQGQETRHYFIAAPAPDLLPLLVTTEDRGAGQCAVLVAHADTTDDDDTAVECEPTVAIEYWYSSETATWTVAYFQTPEVEWPLPPAAADPAEAARIAAWADTTWSAALWADGYTTITPEDKALAGK